MNVVTRRSHLILLSAALLSSMLAGAVIADAFIVKDGEPRAEIVIAEKPARAVDLF